MKTLIVNRKITLSIFVVLLLICGLQSISYAQNAPDDTIAEFVDVNLAKAVREHLGLDTGDGVDILKIPKAELVKLTKLWVVSIEIKNITGLEHATQLTELNLHFSQISDITPLEKLTNLTELTIGDEIRDITPLAQLTNLTELSLDDNQIRDLTPLTQLTNLKELWLRSNEIRDVTPLAQLAGSLKELRLNSNEIRDITPLAQLTNLTLLNLSFNQISDVTPLANLTYLETLMLEGNPIRLSDTFPLRDLLDKNPKLDIDIRVAVREAGGPIVEFSDVNLAKAVRGRLNLSTGDDIDLLKISKAQLVKLRVLDAGGPGIKDLTGLEHATQLTELELDRNNIVDITPLAQLTNLTKLDLTYNNIVDITPLTQLTNLTYLRLWSNPIRDVTPLAQLAGSLESLSLGSNEIHDITPLAQLAGSLESLTLTGINVRDITPLAQLTNLTYLLLGDEIRDITPLANLTNLRRLYLEDNQIRDVTPLTNLTNLKILDLEDNQIRDVSPLANLKYLEELKLRGNPITDTSPLSRLLDENPNLDIDIEVVSEAKLPEVKSPTVTETPTDATVSITPSSVASPAIGQELELSLNITEGEAVAGYQASVQFDTTALRFVSGTNGNYLPVGAFFVMPVVEGNLVKLNAASLAGESNGDGILATLTFEVIAAKASTLTLSDVLLTDSEGTGYVPNLENAQITKTQLLKGDVNGDGIVDIRDLVLVASNLSKTGQNAADVNTDGIVDIRDLVLVAGALGTSAAAPALNTQALSTFTAADVKQWLSQAQSQTLMDTTSLQGIQFLEQLLAALTPKKTVLLTNYPNPFNPETWIPYHLAKPADVTLHIYAVNGMLVRTLSLGHQAAGMYQSRSRAAYWDGKNEFGEKVASGLYFYTLTAGSFSGIRKMLIQK